MTKCTLCGTSIEEGENIYQSKARHTFHTACLDKILDQIPFPSEENILRKIKVTVEDYGASSLEEFLANDTSPVQ